MNILCFASTTKMLEKVRKAAIAVSFTGIDLELYTTIEEFSRRLCQPAEPNRVFILCPRHKKEIEEIISLQDVLSGMKIILVLPKRDKDSIKTAYKIFPRFLAFADEDFSPITMILKKMSASFPRPAAMDTPANTITIMDTREG